MASKCPRCGFENPEDTFYCRKCATPLPASRESGPFQTETLQSPIRELTTGSTFAGRYQIIEELGKGGMGKVYKVNDTKIKEKVALKLIKPEIASDSKTIERFSSEMRLARKIRHKNVCGMFDLGEAEGAHFITMEYVHGEDLKSMIRMAAGLSIGAVLSIGKQVCDGLEEAHNLGVVHRDLKPQNIMIDRDGNAKIMDFGIARSIHEKGITGPSVLIGTPEYMSPEQAEAKEVDQRSDIYSLGIILYEMATGRVPFEGDTALSVAMKHKGETPENPKRLNPGVPEDLSRVILKCLEKDKAKRFQTAAEVRSELEKIGKEIPATQKVLPTRKPLTSREITVRFSLKKLFVPALIFIGVVIVGAVLFLLLRQKVALPLLPQEKRAIAVISFENQTGDAAFDHLRKVIPNLLITSLERSGYFQVATWERMLDLLRQLGKEDVEFIDRDAGFELCRKEGIGSIVLGTFGKAGEIFATDVKVLDVNTKNLLKSASSTGEGEGSILKAQVDELSREIVKALGVAEARIEAEKRRIVDVTTASMEAYDYYLKGKEAGGRLLHEEAKQYYERAVEIDPTFAMAYLGLAYQHQALGNTKEAIEAVRKARAYYQRLTDRERASLDMSQALIVEGNDAKYLKLLQDAARKYPKEKGIHYRLGWYYQGTAGDLEKAINEYEKVLELDPYNVSALNQLGYVCYGRRDFEKAVEYFKKAISANPDFPNPIDSLGDTYFQMGRIDEAIAKFKEALEIRPDFFFSSGNLIYVYALKENYAEAMKWADRYVANAPSPMVKHQGYLWKGFIDFWLGRFGKSLLSLDKAIELAEEAENEGAKGFVHWLKAWLYGDLGEFDTGRKCLEDYLKSAVAADPSNEETSKGWHAIGFGLLDIKSENIDGANKRLAMIQPLLPKLAGIAKEWARFFIDLLQAEILLAEGKAEEAVAAFENTPPMRPTGIQYTRWMIQYNVPSLKDVLARAYIQKGDIDKAIDEYEKLATVDPESEARYLIHPKFYYRLAKLYEQKGWAGKAIENYEKFLNLWKDADPSLPEVDDATKRLTGLRDS
jgi:serine/threonine protein kinase/tetratricopeptide (TPR) repeat protein